jgi:hypothetical protein
VHLPDLNDLYGTLPSSSVGSASMSALIPMERLETPLDSNLTGAGKPG